MIWACIKETREELREPAKDGTIIALQMHGSTWIRGVPPGSGLRGWLIRGTQLKDAISSDSGFRHPPLIQWHIERNFMRLLGFTRRSLGFTEGADPRRVL